MDKLTNIMNARSVIERTSLGVRDKAANDDGPRGLGGSRSAERRASNDARATIERLVLVNGSGQGSPALEKRAQLLASGMNPLHTVIRIGGEDEVSVVNASDLILVDRK